MTSTTDMNVMAGGPPSGVIDLHMAANFNRDAICNIMGVVTDVMEPLSPGARNKAKDWQMTFVLHDNSPLTDGFRVKYFAPEVTGLPAVAIGDVILLRDLKVSEYFGQVGGISNYKTNFVVFPRASIVDPGFRHQYAVHDRLLHHTKKSSLTIPPSIHAQQWAITLKHQVHVETHALKRTYPPMTNNQTPQKHTHSIASEPKAPNNPPQSTPVDSRIASVKKPVDKFSTLDLVTAGKFHDLIVQVVKMFSYDPEKQVELYVTDYTTNEGFHDYEESAGGLDDKWPGPHGKMTLRIDLMPPHAAWTFANIVVNEIVSLKNVLVKLNNNGTGRLEANIWSDKWRGDQINVRKARTGDRGYEDLLARRKTHMEKTRRAFLAGQVRDMGEQKDKKKKKSRSKKKELRDPSELEKIKNESESEDDKGTSAKRRRLDAPAGNVARNVSSDHPDVPLSTYNSVVHSELRANETPRNRIPYTLPFVNVKHRVRLRCTDFYPHDIRDFARAVIDPGPSSKSWEWMFYLVVVAGDPSDSETRAIHVQVSGADAEVLLGRPASDLYSKNAHKAVEHLRNTLWMLWGDLEECKTQFLRNHPDVEANEDWSCMNAGIVPSNLPFEACVEEVGVRFPRIRNEREDEMDVEGMDDLENEGMCWARAWRLFDTRIR